MTAARRESLYPYEGNVLLWQLPESRSFGEWAEAIHYDPRQNWPVPLPERELRDRIMEIDALVVPLYKTITIAEALQRMHRHELIARDPRVEANRKAFYEKAQWKGASIDSLPWFPRSAGGCIIQGPTGTSKSHSSEAAMRGIPNALVREAVPGAWLELHHLVHMTVHMPSDGTRGGLLFSIASEMDRWLGTNYRTEYRLLRTIDKQLVQILMWLLQHRCGMLIIEEAQDENLGVNPFGKEFVQFFMRVLNFGVPVVLIGNPLAFEHHINRHSQVLRRLSYYGNFELNAFPDHRAKGWEREVMSMIWGWSPFSEPEEEIEDLNKLIWDLTGGIDDMVVRLRRETLLAVEKEQGTKVLKRHIEQAYNSPAITSFHRIIEGYWDKSTEKLRRYCDDQPLEYLRRMWGQNTTASTAERAPGSPPVQPVSHPTEPSAQKTARKKAAQGRKRSKSPAIDPHPLAPTGALAPHVAPISPEGGCERDPLDRRTPEFLDSLRAKTGQSPSGSIG
jgi:hypothetical protein